MADPTTYVVPTVGSAGYFELKEPFASQVAKNVRYTCQAVRRISDYISQNENVQETIYNLNKISEVIYEEDKNNDTQIASLQGETGQWIYVPVRFIISYPQTNGIKYRSLALSVGLPAMPVDKDMSSFLASIRNVVTEQLGVNCVLEFTETSKVTQVTSEKHEAEQIKRGLVIGTPTTDRGLYLQTLSQLGDAQTMIATLEKYIEENIPVKDIRP